MTRTLFRAALALACALSVSACQTTLVPGGTISAGDLSAAASTLPPATLSKYEAKVAQVEAYARTACKIIPTVETIVAIFAASNPATATVKSVTDAACAGFKNAGAFAADLPTRAKAKPSAPVGSTVTGTAIVNGRAVPVVGTVVR